MSRLPLLRSLQRIRSISTSSHNDFPKKLYTIPFAEAEKIALQIDAEFKKHPAHNHQLFPWIKKVSQNGEMTDFRAVILRNNYAFRTSYYTLVTAAIQATKAASFGHYKAVNSAGKTFMEEAGDDRWDSAHPLLLMQFLNKHTKRVFGLPPLHIKEIDSSTQFLVPEALEYRKMQDEKLLRAPYPLAAGVFFAQEGAAHDMLEGLKAGFVEPFRGYYSESDYKKLIRYFTAHYDPTKKGGDVEKEHARRALKLIAEIISSDPSLEEKIIEGGKMFLDAQADLWTGIMRVMEKVQDRGIRAEPKSEFLPERKSGKNSNVPSLTPIPKSLEATSKTSSKVK